MVLRSLHEVGLLLVLISLLITELRCFIDITYFYHVTLTSEGSGPLPIEFTYVTPLM